MLNVQPKPAFVARFGANAHKPETISPGGKLQEAHRALSETVYSDNGMGQHYTNPNHPVVRRAVQLVRETKARDVLDLASGRGITALSLARETDAKRILATDINREGLQEIRKAAKAENLPVTARYLNAGAELPATLRGKFDAVIAKDLFPFLGPAQTKKLMRNAAEALKPGGWFLVTAPSTRSRLFEEAAPKKSGNDLYRKLSDQGRRFIQTTQKRFSFSTVEDLAKRMRQVGIEMTEAQHYGRAQGWIIALGQKRASQ